MIFQTERLYMQQFGERDKEHFIELLSNPIIINPIPQPQHSLEVVEKHFSKCLDYSTDPSSKKQTVWGIYEQNKTELVGLCALLTNDENQREIGYRFRPQYWGKGYGTEVTKHLIDYCFNQLNFDLITADVNIENIGSVKILDKFFTDSREFYNEKDQCMDRRYTLKKENWTM